MVGKVIPQSVMIGYGRDLEVYNSQLPFHVKLPKLERIPLSPFEEAQIAARKIFADVTATPSLCLSGGLDSEATALAFLAAKIPFDVTTLRFKDGLNSHDTDRATEFCQKHSLRQTLIDLDVVDFFESGKYLPYLDKYNCHTLEIAAQLWFIEQIEKPFVWSAETFRMLLQDGQPHLQAVSEFEAVIYRYVAQNKLCAVPNFHFYSAELAWSFLRESLKFRGHAYPNDHCAEFYNEKLAFYKHCGFLGLENPLRKQKLHGFELVKKYFDIKLAPESYNSVYRLPFLGRNPIVKKTIVEIPKDDVFAREIIGLEKIAENL